MSEKKKTSSALKVKCPSCATEMIWDSSNAFRPFCSERCRILDLGEWASGNRTIASDAEHDDITAHDLDRD